MNEIDVWQTARGLVAIHGDQVAEYASRRMTEMAMEGDREGADVWSAVLYALAVLHLQKPMGGQSRH